MNIAPFSYFSNKINQIKFFSNSVNFASKSNSFILDSFERQYDYQDDIGRLKEKISSYKTALKKTQARKLEEKNKKSDKKFKLKSQRRYEKECSEAIEKQLKHQKRELEEYEYCLNICQNGSKTDIFADKKLDDESFERICVKLGLVSLSSFAYEMGVDDSVVKNWRKSGVIECNRAVGPRIKGKLYVVDVYNEKTKKLLTDFKKRKAQLLTPKDFIEKYGISYEEYTYLQACGKLKFFGLDESVCSDTSRCDTSNVLVDTEDEKTIDAIKIIKKSHPSPSSYMRKAQIPADYLHKLGFADMYALMQCVSDGTLEGRIEKKDSGSTTKYVIFVDNNSEKNEKKLKSLRAKNKDIVEITELARQTGRTVFEIQRAILDGDLKIIPSYVFESDKDKVFINTGNKKNYEYITKIKF